MSTQYFTSDIITADEYVGYVRMVFQLQSAIDMVGLDGGIQVVNNGLRFYNEEDEDITSKYKDLKRLGVDTTLLLKHNSVISDCIVCLDTTVMELYDKVCHAVVSDYGNIARHYRSAEDKNLVPSFVYLREFDNQDESDKVKLLYEYQYLYDYINNLCNMNTGRGMDDIIMTQYDVHRDCVNFVIQHNSIDAVTPNTLIRNNIAIRLLPTVVFSGYHDVKVRDVLNNIDTVIRYLIRLHAGSFKVAYHGLKDATDKVIHSIGLQSINYVTENNGFVAFGDNVFSVYVADDRVKRLVSQLNYVHKVECFFKAIESHKHLLNTPIIDNYVTVASAIQSYLRYQYESVMGSSGYQIYDATLKEVYDIIFEVRDMMVSSFNFIDFDEDIFNVVDNLWKLSVIVDSCDKKEGEKMKVVHTKETKLVRSNESRNLMLAKDLALEFIDSGYDVIMRDGDDLVVYSNTDTSMQEYVPKSLHNVFYDVDKLDLLPLSYYVYMCK